MTETLSSSAPSRDDGSRPRPGGSPTVVALVAVAGVVLLALAAAGVVAVVDGDDVPRMEGAGRSMMPDDADSDDVPGGSAPDKTVPGAREVKVRATSFFFQPGEVTVRAGEDVTIVLTATDINHDFTVDELDLSVAAHRGQAGRASFRAPSEPGTYTAYCSVSGHRRAGMTASVIVAAA